ncbi:DUF4870 domain-containing protein [Candidatus Woesearchaeota archaeon]|nr:DUF4870 domain-containing protein [Candidatus Woesearchaeota archaeon]
MAKDSNSQLCAILSYLLIGIIWYFADEKMKKDSYAKYHVKQAVVLLIFSIIWGVALSIFSMALILLWPLWMLLNYVPLILVIIGILNAVNSKEKELPVIGGYASKLTF